MIELKFCFVKNKLMVFYKRIKREKVEKEWPISRLIKDFPTNELTKPLIREVTGRMKRLNGCRRHGW